MLSISIVIYHLDQEVFRRLLLSLSSSIAELPGNAEAIRLWVINNGSKEGAIQECLDGLKNSLPQIEILKPARNLGYGRGHNLAIDQSNHRYHLVLNPDVILDKNCLKEGIAFMDANPEVAATAPYATDGASNYQCLAKRYPAVFDLFLRGFMPRFVLNLFSNRLARYEERRLEEVQSPVPVEIISGCFMLCRNEALKKAGGFDDHYFLYFEDFSLSLKLGELGSLYYLPAMKIVHLGGNAAKKGLTHLQYFCTSAIKFYNQHGWKFI